MHTRPADSALPPSGGDPADPGPPAALVVRRAVPADAAALSAFAARCFRETYAPPHGDARPADVEAYVADHFAPSLQAAELDDAGTVVLLLVSPDTGALAGYAQLRAGAAPAGVVGARPVELARFYVDRPWHGRGAAQRLMAACRATGADPLWLSVYQRNPRAVAFYARCGFAVVGEATFLMGDDLQHDWIMASHS